MPVHHSAFVCLYVERLKDPTFPGCAPILFINGVDLSTYLQIQKKYVIIAAWSPMPKSEARPNEKRPTH